ncbi:MAG: hypothetical protein WCT07_04030 [Candidatus Paceibacterota bacterium]|jgi:hypothetical protein
MKAYETCPICNKSLIHSSKINKKCDVLEKNNFSFVESLCNHSNFVDIGDKLPTHLYLQVVSLYGDLLYEKISFPIKRYEISVNYVARTTKLIYSEKVINLKRVIQLDYPDLIIAKQKLKTMALFL